MVRWRLRRDEACNADGYGKAKKSTILESVSFVGPAGAAGLRPDVANSFAIIILGSG